MDGSDAYQPRAGDTARLVRRAQQGDQAALDGLVERFGRMVLGVARRIVRHPEDAEDVGQEVFIKLVRHVDQVDSRRPIEPWLVQVTVNTAKSLRSRRPSRLEQPLLDREHPETGNESAADGGLATEDVRDAIRAACATLTDREHEVFALRDLEQLDTALVAEALGISAVTVRRLSAKARQKVAAWLRAHRPELCPPPDSEG